MRALVLSAVLGVAALGMVAVTPSQASAAHHRAYGWSGYYGGPAWRGGSHYRWRGGSHYYSPRYYAPNFGYYAPGSFYAPGYNPYPAYGGYYGPGALRWWR